MSRAVRRQLLSMVDMLEKANRALKDALTRNDLDLPWERLDKAEELKKYL